MSKAKFCPFCGETLEECAVYCPACGQRKLLETLLPPGVQRRQPSSPPVSQGS